MKKKKMEKLRFWLNIIVAMYFAYFESCCVKTHPYIGHQKTLKSHNYSLQEFSVRALPIPTDSTSIHANAFGHIVINKHTSSPQHGSIICTHISHLVY